MLEEARGLGFLGPGPVDAHLDHAAGFVEAIRAGGPDEPARAAELGSGGGVPGLALAVRFPQTAWLFVESAVRRAGFLRDAVRSLGLANVGVAEARAEVVGRQGDRRGAFTLVVARSFGPPAVVAECAAPLLALGGRAVVSEPPQDGAGRWPVDGLGMVGMSAGPRIQARGATFQVLVQEGRCPDRYPRRVGAPAKRPLFETQPSTNVPRETKA